MFTVGIFLSSIFFSVGLNLLNTERVFLANMGSAGAIPELAFTLGVLRFLDNNFCNSSFTVSIPLAYSLEHINKHYISDYFLFKERSSKHFS